MVKVPACLISGEGTPKNKGPQAADPLLLPQSRRVLQEGQQRNGRSLREILDRARGSVEEALVLYRDKNIEPSCPKRIRGQAHDKRVRQGREKEILLMNDFIFHLCTTLFLNKFYKFYFTQ